MRRRIWEIAGIMLLTATSFGPLAHAQDNLRDGAPFNGYTGVSFDTTNYSYDYLVDSTLSQDEPAGKKFKTLQAAYAAAPAGTAEKPTVIGIKPDVYLLHVGESAPYSMQLTKDNITILGLTDDRRKVVFADNRCKDEGATNDGFIFVINANGFSMINLTVLDYCNIDYEYPGDPSRNLKMRSPVVSQGVVIEMSGDKHIYSHVAFLSRLDTTVLSATRAYFTNVFIEGNADFIAQRPGSVEVFKDSEAYFPTGSGGLAAQGLIFINTVFKASKGMVFYSDEGNTEKSVGTPDTLIDCVVPAETPTTRVAWMADAAIHQNSYTFTYHLRDSNGKPTRIKDSETGRPSYNLSRELSDEEAKTFNPWNLLRGPLSGPADDWDPAKVRTQYENNGNDVFRMSVTGAVPAGGRSGPGHIVSPTVRTGASDAPITVAAFPTRANPALTWSTPSNLVTLSSPTGSKVTIVGNNHTNRAEWVVVEAKAADGFHVMVPVNVEPAFIDPPKVTAKPVIASALNGKVAVHYTLDLGGREDQSLITWYQCDDATCTDPHAVAVSRGDQPLKSYTLTIGDVGKYLRAGIQPRHNISEAGPAVVATMNKPVVAANLSSTTIHPNFRNFVPTANPAIESGEWTVIGDWTPVTGSNFIDGYALRINGLAGTVPRGSVPATTPQPIIVNGVRVANPYAALLYQNDQPTGDMTVKVVMSPDKTAGQGFALSGSPDDTPRMDRADIFIKYDPRTRNGYSLRFWRTIQSEGKCVFQLYKIEDGVGHPLNDQQDVTGVFKPDTTITLAVVGTKLTVKGANTKDGDTLSLEGAITPNMFGGAGVFWAGSANVGQSNVYSEIEISYPSSAKHGSK